MAEEHQKGTEAKDRGVFDFLGKKKEAGEQEKPPQVREQAVGAGLENVRVAAPEARTEEPKEEEKKHESLLEKLHRSSSSSDEEEIKDGEKKKKGSKEKVSGEKKDTSVPVEKVPFKEVSTGHVETTTNRPAVESEEEKGFLEKIKDKLPSGKKPGEHEPEAAAPPPATAEVREGEAGKEKKGIVEKIKKKIPGQHKEEERKCVL